MKNSEEKPKIETRSIKHIFTPEERADLSNQFGAAYDAVKSNEADFDAVKAVHKSKITESESRMTTLRATINAGFEMRETECVVVYDVPTKKKTYFLLSDYSGGALNADAKPVLVEAMQPQDFQAELIQAESQFECREEIPLFETVTTAAGISSGVMVVGRLDGKWFSALRVKLGEFSILERLNSEQPCSKKRAEQINRTAKRFSQWLDEKLDRDTGKGFRNALELMKAAHAERVE